MSSAIADPPQVYGYGLQFNYSNWTEGTVLTLVNVPWNNDYRDVVRFATRDDLDSYIDSAPNQVIRNMSLGKFNQNVKVEIPINAAMRYNYVRADNGLMPIGGDTPRKYYYFVTDVIYVNPSVTELVLQLDVFQTFIYDVTLGSCFVERGHIGIANTNAFSHYGRDYLSEPEGLDVGGEYRTVHTAGETIIQPNADVGYSVLICSTLDLTIDPGTLGTLDNPQFKSSRGSTIQNIPSGATFYVFKTGADFEAWLTQYQDKPWITQGIISVTLIPNVERYYPGYNWVNVAPTGIQAFYKAPNDYPTPVYTNLETGWRNAAFIANILGTRYAGLKKFLTYPYMVIELTTWTGSPVIIRPEMWQDADARIHEMCALVPPGQRIAVMPFRYNYDAETDYTDNSDPAWTSNDDKGEFLDMAAVISNFPQLPIINDMAIAYLAQNRNSLDFQYRSADWSQQRALRSNQVGYDQASAGINLATNLTGVQQNQIQSTGNIQARLAAQHAVVNSLGQVAGSALEGNGAALAGGLMAGVGTAMNAGLTAGGIQEQAGLAFDTAGRANQYRQGTAGYMRDTNKGLADFAARGDYENTIAGIHAKIQDARMTQPSVSGQFNGDTFNMVFGYIGFSLRWKMPNLNVLRAIGDYWLRYGYSVRQFVPIPTNLQCMSKFTYWKLTETYISQAPIPEGFKQIIRGIFEKGVTVWNDPSYIGVTDWADNQPLNGVSF